MWEARGERGGMTSETEPWRAKTPEHSAVKKHSSTLLQWRQQKEMHLQDLPWLGWAQWWPTRSRHCYRTGRGSWEMLSHRWDHGGTCHTSVLWTEKQGRRVREICWLGDERCAPCVETGDAQQYEGVGEWNIVAGLFTSQNCHCLPCNIRDDAFICDDGLSGVFSGATKEMDHQTNTFLSLTLI